jgi:ABC-type glycerol-3-phosphate transport system substrate-binding protein
MRAQPRWSHSPRAAAWLGAGALLALVLAAPAAAQEKLTGISHRHGSLEFYAQALDRAVPGVRVDMSLMPVDKAFELQTINLSSGSDAYDIIWVNDAQLKKYAKSGWLEPLDAHWARFKAELNLGDYPESVLDSFRYEGKLYAVPAQVNGMFFFYRADLFKEKGLQPPTTFEAWTEAARVLNTPQRAGTIMSLKRVDAALNETHYYFTALGDGWFDARWKPVFNSPRGVAAIERMKALAKFAPPGFTSHANDEAMVTLQQDLAAMGLQWFTRAAAMDDPAKSKVAGKMAWAAPPVGGQRIVVDGYAISRFSRKNKETTFRVLATATSEANQRAIAKDAVPSRASVLNDAELQARFRHYPAALAALRVGKPYPPLPEFPEVGDIVTRYVHRAVTGEMPVKAALDAAAAETEELLKKRGYYQ